MLGFGPEDNEAISEGPILPLFVCEMEKSPYIYLGNYIAKRLDPVAWESLSTEVCLFSFCERSSKLSFDWYLTRERNAL